MTDWIALGDALIAYRQPPEPRQTTFKRMLDHHARGTLECRAMLTARGRQPREVSVPPQAWGLDAPFWFRLLDALKADTFPVIWPREREAVLWQVEFRGGGMAAADTLAPAPSRVLREEWKSAMRELIEGGETQTAAIQGVRDRFGKQALPSRTILRDEAAKIVLSLGRDPSRTGPRPSE